MSALLPCAGGLVLPVVLCCGLFDPFTCNGALETLRNDGVVLVVKILAMGVLATT
jgi:hypothetical protein